jgi:hypothetical protein
MATGYYIAPFVINAGYTNSVPGTWFNGITTYQGNDNFGVLVNDLSKPTIMMYGVKEYPSAVIGAYTNPLINSLGTPVETQVTTVNGYSSLSVSTSIGTTQPLYLPLGVSQSTETIKSPIQTISTVTLQKPVYIPSDIIIRFDDKKSSHKHKKHHHKKSHKKHH